jgi:LmbE family N-acetylglucosaminyl deacetylase
VTATQLLVVTAHPDDEVTNFGGLIYVTAHAGARITLVCATRGEVGEIADPALATPETLGMVREEELRAACAILGVADLRFLDYRDSGMAGTSPNENPRAFMRARADEVARRLVAIMRELRPAVVATFDPSGGSGHPDHMAANRHATAAFDLAGQDVLPECGPPYAPAALYYAARPAGLREEARAELAARGVAVPASRPSNGLGDAERLPITATLDVMVALEAKRTARAAHRTQVSPMSQIHLLSEDLQRRFTGTEYFHRARPAWQPGDDDSLLRLLALAPASVPPPH